MTYEDRTELKFRDAVFNAYEEGKYIFKWHGDWYEVTKNPFGKGLAYKPLKFEEFEELEEHETKTY